MNSEDKFKELLNDKLGAKDFPFQADHWEKAQVMIDAARAKKKRRAVVFWILFGLTLGISSLLLFNLPSQTNEVATLPATPPAGISSSSSADAVNAPSETTQARQKTGSRNNLAEQALTNSDAATPGSKETAAGTTETAKQPVASEKTETVVQEDTKADITIKAKKKKTPVTPAAPVLAAKEKDKAADPSSETTRPSKTKVTSPETDKPVAENKDEEETTTTIAKGAETVPGKEATPGGVAPATATIEQLPTTELPVTTASVTPEVPAATASVATIDSAAIATATPGPVTKPALMRHLFFVEAGVNCLAGWPAPEKRDALGINPVFGVGYLNQLSESIGLSLGLQYTSISPLGAYSHTSMESTLGLGAESSVTVITPTKLHYLAIPLKLSANIDQNSAFGVGYTLAYLITTQSDVETYDQKPNFSSELGPVYATTNHVQSKVIGYTQGFNSFDSQVSFFYRRRIHKELWVNADLLFGLTDIKDNKFFASNRFERNLGLKVTLTYNLFKK